MGIDTMEERRKKATLRKIEREHAGKITQPYRILEELIEAHHPRLREARFILLWKSGWKADKDGVLVRAKIRKVSEAEREVWGDYDFMILLHRELWACKGFSEASRRHDIDHELCHAGPEIDDATGEQLRDERDRLCWRIVKHKIQTFPELIERHGLQACTGIDAEAQAVLEADGPEAERDIAADENDAQRPLLRQEAGSIGDRTSNADWKTCPIVALQSHDKKLSDKALEALEAADIRTLGELQAAMRRHGEFWAKELGIHGRYRVTIEDAMNACVTKAEEEAERRADCEAMEEVEAVEDADDAEEMPPEAVGTVRIHLRKTVRAEGLEIALRGTVVEAFVDADGDVFVAYKREEDWLVSYPEAADFERIDEAEQIDQSPEFRQDDPEEDGEADDAEEECVAIRPVGKGGKKGRKAR